MGRRKLSSRKNVTLRKNPRRTNAENNNSVFPPSEENHRVEIEKNAEVANLSDGSEAGEVPLEGTDDGVFVVDKILDKKITDGKVHYFLRWLGYGPEWDTWEPEDNLACPGKIAEFEKEYEQRSTEPEKRGFARGLKPIDIIGLTRRVNGGPKPTDFVVRWEGTDEADLVPMSECNEKIPEMVIQYYSDRLMGLWI